MTMSSRIRGSRKWAIRISLLLIMLAGALRCANAADVITCGLQQADTAPVRSSANFTAVLKMQSGDDHGRNTHLCATEYTLQITRPDGLSMQTIQFGFSVDNWDRPLVFRIDGFSREGNNAFVFISEGVYPQLVEMHEYDMNRGKHMQEVFLDRHFTKRLSRACAATLRIIGTSPNGAMVLGTGNEHGCSRAQLWELTSDKGNGPAGDRLLPQHAKLLSSMARIYKLEAGEPVQR